MSVPFQKTVFLVDAMAFRRARAESFLSPWARNESVELISLDPDEAHARLVERAGCDPGTDDVQVFLRELLALGRHVGLFGVIDHLEEEAAVRIPGVDDRAIAAAGQRALAGCR